MSCNDDEEIEVLAIERDATIWGAAPAWAAMKERSLSVLSSTDCHALASRVVMVAVPKVRGDLGQLFGTLCCLRCCSRSFSSFPGVVIAVVVADVFFLSIS